MIEELTHPNVITFIQEHFNDDPVLLMLKAQKYSELPIKSIVDQIASRQKAVYKLPEWVNNPKIIFPPKQNLEQASSQRTAEFKSRFLKGKMFVDLTGGTGIDSYYLAKNFDESFYIEPDSMLCKVAEHNFKQLGSTIRVKQATAESFLARNSTQFTWMYIDPSRRDNQKNRLYALDDCAPNVLDLKSVMLSNAEKVLLKASPMLDIKRTLKDLDECYLVQIVAVNNDVKELLFYLDKDFNEEATIEAWNLLKENNEESFSFKYSEENSNFASIGHIKTYIYEPNSAIMKSGGFNMIANEFKIKKLHQNTHLYTSDELIDGFPGKILKVKDVFSASKKVIKQHVKKGIVNLIVRNFPQGVNQIKKKLKLKDGGDDFLVLCDTETQGFRAILCGRVN